MIISTGRLVLRSLTKASPKQVSWLRDKEIVKFSEQRHREHTLSSQLRYVESFAGRSQLWAIYRTDTGEQIGTLSAMVDEPNNVADVGIMIGDKAAWGKGFGGEAWQGACSWLLSPQGGGVRKLEAGCMRVNEPMMKILRRSLFVLEGQREKHFLLDGREVAMVLYGRFR